MNRKDARRLLEKYRSGKCTDEEKALVEAWYDEWGSDESVPDAREIEFMREQTWNHLAPLPGRRKLSLYAFMGVAASLLVIATAGIFLWSKTPEAEITRTASVVDDALPGGNRATITLDDGRVIDLEEAGTGQIASLEGARVYKTRDGEVKYEADWTSASAERRYNTITTPRGGQYDISLPDGTRVWLNAESSLRYPVAFGEGLRAVELTGEAYFEVAHREQPFVVTAGGQRVQVLGTQFNISSYEEELSVETTLLEGSVSVQIENLEDLVTEVILEPSQQATLVEGSLRVSRVNASDVVAWKNGYFSFVHADIETIMRELARWYDLRVEYEGPVPIGTFSGKVQRNIRLSQVLQILAFSEVNFRIEDKKIIVFP